MKKFSFSNQKGLSKSTILNHQSSIGLGTKLRSLLLLVVAIMTCGEAWGQYQANMTVKSQPSSGGLVYVGMDNSCSEASCTKTEDDAKIKKGNIFDKPKDVTFYLCHKTASGYTFKGWSTSSTATSGEGASSNPYAKSVASASYLNPKEYTYYAIYSPNTYTVNLNDNSGSGGSGSVTATYDAAMPSANKPSRSGYQFDGYFDAQSGGTKYYNADMSSAKNWDKASGSTLYAQWTPQYYGKANAYQTPSNSGYVWVGQAATAIPSDFSTREDHTGTQTSTGTQQQNFNFVAKSDNGYQFVGWYNDDTKVSDGDASKNYLYSGPFTITSQNSSSPTQVNLTAHFHPSEVTSVNSPSISFNKAEAKTATVTFNVAYADAVADFNYSTSGDGWTFDNWTYSSNQVSCTAHYTATTSTSKGAHTGTVTLTSKGNSSSYKTATVTANVDLTPTLTYNNGTVAISLDESAQKRTIDLNTLKTAYSGDGQITYALVTPNDNVKIEGSTFYSKVAGDIKVRATASAVSYYAKSVDFTVTVTKRKPTVSWTPTDPSAVHFVEGETITANAGISQVNLSVAAENEPYISCSGNTATILGYKDANAIVLKATTVENDQYSQFDTTTNVYITNLFKQVITWNQPELTKLKTTDATKKIKLTAIDNNVPSRASEITYALSGDQTGVSLSPESDGCYLIYSNQACKNTFVTANLTGVKDVSIAATPVQLPIKVTDPDAKCDVNEVVVSSLSLSNDSKVYNISTPETFQFGVKKSKGDWWVVYAHAFYARFYTGENATGTEVFSKTCQQSNLDASSYKTYTISASDLQNNKDIKSVKFETEANYGFDIQNANYNHYTYCTGFPAKLDFETYAATPVANQSFTINYANYQVELSIDDNSNFSITTSTSFGDCATYGSQTVTVHYNTPSLATVESSTLYIKDNSGTVLGTVTLNANVIGGIEQHITEHNIKTSYKTTDRVEMTAKTDHGLSNFTFTPSSTDIATVDGNIMTFKKSGTINLTIYEPGNATYLETDSTISNIVISKVTPTITTIPTAAAITYGAQLKTSALTGGVAKVNLRGTDTEVTGTWSWDEGEDVKTANSGTALSYPVTFTPNDGGMYTTAKCSVSVQINRAEQAIAWTQTIASPQTFRDTITLTASTVVPGGEITYSVSPADKATVDGNKLYLNKGICNSLTVTANAKATVDYLANTDSKSFEIARRNPVMTKCDIANSYMVDDAALDLNTLWKNDGDGVVTYDTVSFTPSGINNTDAVRPKVTDNRYLSLGQAGTLKIKMSIAQGANYNAKVFEKIITINKYTNFLYVNGTAAYATSIGYGAGEYVTLTTNNPVSASTPIIIRQTAGGTSATYYNGETPVDADIDTPIEDLTKLQAIYASHIGGTATWTLNQAENYKYASASATIQATIKAQSITCNVKDAGSYKAELSFGGTSEEITWNDDNAAGTLHFQMHGTFASISNKVQIYQKIGDNWSQVGSDISNYGYEDYEPFEQVLSPVAKGIRFYVEGSLTTYITGIYITRKPHLTPETTDITLPQITHGSSSQSTFNFAWSTCAGEINIVSSNPKFTVSPTSIASTTAGNQTITITYSSATAETDAQSTITFYTPYEETTVTAHGTTVGKLATHIEWNGRADKNYAAADGEQVNPFIVRDINGNVVSDAQITYVTGNSYIASVNATNYTFTPYCGGDVVLTASYAGNEIYQAAVNYPETIHVALCEPNIEWEQTFLTYTDKNIGESTSLSTTVKNIEGVTLSVAYSYATENPEVASVEDNSKLVIKGVGSTNLNYTITANAKDSKGRMYNTPSESRMVRVRKQGESCNTVYPQEEIDINTGEDANKFSFDVPCDTLRFKIRKSSSILIGDHAVTVRGFIPATATQEAQTIVIDTYESLPTSYGDHKVYPIDERIRTIQFYMPEGVSGYRYVRDLEVRQKKYIRPMTLVNSERIGFSEINKELDVNNDFVFLFDVDFSDIPQLQVEVTDLASTIIGDDPATANIKLENVGTTKYNDCTQFGTMSFKLTGKSTKWRTIKGTIHFYTSADDVVDIPFSINWKPAATYDFEVSDGTWNENTKWHIGGQPAGSIPSSANIVNVVKSLTINGQVECYRLIIGNGGKVTIAPNGGLTVGAGGIQGFTSDNFRIQSATTNQGYFRMSPETDIEMPSATVEYATKGTLSTGANKDATWQYFGIPVASDLMNVDYITWFYRWSEPDGWTGGGNNVGLVPVSPWTGYCVTQYGQPVYEWKGQLLNGSQTCNLTIGGAMQGDNMVANSFASPIDVKKFTEADFSAGKIAATFYIYNSGSWNSWKQQTDSGQKIVNKDAPGSFRAIPILSAKDLDGKIDQTLIAPMQGICIHANQADAWVKFDYAKHVWPATADSKSQMIDPLRAPSRLAEDSVVDDSIVVDPDTLQRRVRLHVYAENSGADHLYLLQREKFTMDYDNGYDAPKVMTNGLLSIYTREEEADMAVSARKNIDSTYVGFLAGEDEVYRMTVTSVIGDSLYLKDLANNVEIQLVDNQIYTFNATAFQKNDKRFLVYMKKQKPFTPTTTNNVASDVYIWVDADFVHIENAAANSLVGLYSSDGKLLLSETINRHADIAIDHLVPGMYLVYVDGKPMKFVKK